MNYKDVEFYKEPFLMHYGVMGMRWGKRKRRVSVKSSSNNRKSNQSGQRRMSNKELTAKVKRLKLEQEYAKLTATPKTVSKVEKLVKTAGTIAALTGSAATIYKNLNDLGVVSKGKGA